MKLSNKILGLMLLAATSVYAGMPQSGKWTLSGKNMRSEAVEHSALSNQIASSEIAYPYSVENNQIMLDLTLKVSGSDIREKLEAVGCKITANTKTVYFVRIPTSNIEKLQALPEVSAIDIPGKLKVDMDISRPMVGADAVTVDNNLTPSNVIAGEGVVVGVFDTGIDLTHEDFSDENGTRVRYFWDMSRENEPGHPQNYDWGTEYSKEYIDANLQNIDNVDGPGHGTHVAGTAAGGGRIDYKMRGIASKSDLIIVKGTRDDASGAMIQGDIIAGLQYMIAKAKELNKPIVINMSEGSNYGYAYDGTDLLSLAINEMSEPGVIFTVAAGNNNGYPVHGGTLLSEGKSVSVPLYPVDCSSWGIVPLPSYPEYEDNQNFKITGADVWYDAETIDSLSFTLYSLSDLRNGIHEPKYKYTFGVNNDLNVKDMPVLDGGIGYLSAYATPADPVNGDGNCLFVLHNGANASAVFDGVLWCVEATGKKDGYFDVWGGAVIDKSLLPFSVDLPGREIVWCDSSMAISTPAVADSAISVGGFNSRNSWTNTEGKNAEIRDFEVGAIFPSSSRGPRRDRRQCPTISAPGAFIFAPKSSTMNQEYLSQLNMFIMSGGKYIGMPGTSMAAPHVAGAIALMLQVNPQLSAHEASEILMATANQDAFTGETPNNKFGSGKLDVQKAIDYMLKKNGVEYVMANDVKVYPLPASDFVNIELSGDAPANSSQVVYNESGKQFDVRCETAGEYVRLNISNLPSGVYFGENGQANKFKFVVK